MSKHQEGENSFFPHSEDVEYAVWTPTEFKVGNTNRGKLRPRTIKKVTESMLNEVIEHTLVDQAVLPPPSESFEPEVSVDPLSLIPADVLESAKQQGFDEGFVQGHTDGYQSGLEQGHAEGFANAKAELTRLESIVAQASTIFTEFEEQIAPQLLALSIQITKRLVRRELNTDRTLILKVIEEAFLELLGSETQKRLLLHPTDIQIVQKELGESLKLSEWELYPDESITPGGCKIHSKETDIDATVERNWKRLMIGLSVPPETAACDFKQPDIQTPDDSEEVPTIAEPVLDESAQEMAFSEEAESLSAEGEPILEELMESFQPPEMEESTPVTEEISPMIESSFLPSDDALQFSSSVTDAPLHTTESTDSNQSSTDSSLYTSTMQENSETGTSTFMPNHNDTYAAESSYPAPQHAFLQETNELENSITPSFAQESAELPPDVLHSSENELSPEDVQSLIDTGLEAAFTSALEMNATSEPPSESSNSETSTDSN